MRTEVIAGQYLDLLSQAAGDDSLDSALRVVSYKSAKYTIERPLHLGVALACATADPDLVLVRRGEKAIADACTAYGIPLGIAFQLRDDVLGIFGDPAETGKPVSGDLREGKRTVLIAMARRRASAAQAEILDRYLGDRLVDEAGAAAVREVVVIPARLAECEEMIDRNVAVRRWARWAARRWPPAKEALAELASRRRLQRLIARGGSRSEGQPAVARSREASCARRGGRVRCLRCDGRTTTTRRAPAARVLPVQVAQTDPADANHGRPAGRLAAYPTSSSPAAGRPGLVGVAQTGPAQKYPRQAPARRAALLRGGMRGQPDQRSGAE